MTYSVATLGEELSSRYKGHFFLKNHEDDYDFMFITHADLTLFEKFLDIRHTMGTIYSIRLEKYGFRLSSWGIDYHRDTVYVLEGADKNKGLSSLSVGAMLVPIENYNFFIIQIFLREFVFVLTDKETGKLYGSHSVGKSLQSSPELARFMLRYPMWNWESM